MVQHHWEDQHAALNWISVLEADRDRPQIWRLHNLDVLEDGVSSVDTCGAILSIDPVEPFFALWTGNAWQSVPAWESVTARCAFWPSLADDPVEPFLAAVPGESLLAALADWTSRALWTDRPNLPSLAALTAVALWACVSWVTLWPDRAFNAGRSVIAVETGITLLANSSEFTGVAFLPALAHRTDQAVESFLAGGAWLSTLPEFTRIALDAHRPDGPVEPFLALWAWGTVFPVDAVRAIFPVDPVEPFFALRPCGAIFPVNPIRAVFTVKAV